MSVIVYHKAGETVHDVMDGRLYSVPSGEPFEFASTFLGRKFIEHKHWYGVVEVRTIRTRTGIEFDLADADARAEALLLQKDEEVIQAYVSTQYDDRLSQGKPALKPGGRAAIILQKHNINLTQYGIRPVGTLEGNAQIGAAPVDHALKAEVASLKSLVMMFLAGDGISKEEKAALVRDLMNTPADAAPPADPTQLHNAPEVHLRTSEAEVVSKLGEATEGSGSLPGDPAADGIIDLSRSYAALGTAPGVEDVPPTSGPIAPVQGNMSARDVVSTLGRVQPPASRRRNG